MSVIGRFSIMLLGRMRGNPEATLNLPLMGITPVSGDAASRVSTGNPAPLQRLRIEHRFLWQPAKSCYRLPKRNTMPVMKRTLF